MTTEPMQSQLERRFQADYLRERLRRQVAYERHVARYPLSINGHYLPHWLLAAFLKVTGLRERGEHAALDIQVTQHTFHLPDLPAAFDGFRIMHLSDLHIDIDDRLPDAIVAGLHGLDADICVMTGDYRQHTVGSIEPAVAGIMRLRTHLKPPVYLVLGNHDFVEMVPLLEAMQMRVLVNEWTFLERKGEKIVLAGIDDARLYKTHDFNAMREPIASHFTILLSHTPTVYLKAEKAGCSLMLSGHTHGGQVCLPGGWRLFSPARCPAPMQKGAFQYGKLQGYTSRGTGSTGVMVRYHCPPEIAIHELRAI